MKVNDLMTVDVVAVTPETSLKDVARLLAEHRISGVPVVGEGGRVLGVVSEADILYKERGEEPRSQLLDWLLDSRSRDREKTLARTAGDAMTSPAITINAHADVSAAARTMTEQQVKRLTVIDWSGALVGIVTRADLVRAFARSDEELEDEIRSDLVAGVFAMNADAVDVRVEKGEATLDGEMLERLDAAILPRLVARVPGVVAVRSTLRWREDSRDAENRETYASVASKER